MAAAAALFCGIFLLLGVQMAIGDDPAIGPGHDAGKTRTHQKAQGGGEPIVPPAGDREPSVPQYAEPERYYDQPYGEDGYYGQSPQGYGQGPQYQEPGYQQPQQQYAPPVQSGPS